MKCEICGEPMYFIRYTIMGTRLYTCKNKHSIEEKVNW